MAATQESSSRMWLVLLLLAVMFTQLVRARGTQQHPSANMTMSEVEALISFAKGRPDPRHYLSNWTQENSHRLCVDWYGVECDQANHVVALDIYGSYIGGEITQELTLLPYLKRLVFSGIHFTGGIPSFIGQITTLTHLELYCFGISNFGGNVPDSIGELHGLENLMISECNMSGSIPTSIFRLTQLRTLDLSDNILSGEIPNSIGQLSRLEELYLSFNKFIGNVPPSMARLSRLKYLDLSGHYFPNAFPLLPFSALEGLYLSGCNLSGAIPHDDIVEHRSTLKELDLSHNHLSGSIPPQLGQLMKLEMLLLNNNALSGTIPDGVLGNLKFLNHLDLSSNNLSGRIPDEMARYLEILILSNNKFTTFPPSLTNCASLMTLSLKNNSITGEVPRSIGQLSKLRTLLLGHNELTGRIDDINFGGMWSLNILSLESNKLSGRFPTTLNCSCVALNLRNNSLSGSLPDALGASNNIGLSLANNLFSGTIPSWIYNNSFLQILDLSNNMLNGYLPATFVGFKSTYKGSNAEALGKIGIVSLPADISNFASMTLNVRGTEEEFFNLYSDMATILDLSMNNFEGELPHDIGSLYNLRYLLLSNNNFSGSIPSSMQNLTKLLRVNLAHNKLTGKIPPSLSNLAALSYFDVSYNNLNGPIPTGHQFTTFNPNWFMENAGLCGPPLENSCGPGVGRPSASQTTSEEKMNQDWLKELFSDDMDPVAFGLGIFIGFSALTWVFVLWNT